MKRADRDNPGLVLVVGVPVMTESGERVGESRKAAQQGIAKVVLSRIGMAAPGMVSD